MRTGTIPTIPDLAKLLKWMTEDDSAWICIFLNFTISGIAGCIPTSLLKCLAGHEFEHDDEISERHQQIAAALQKVFEEKVAEILGHLHRRTGMDTVVLSGGCFHEQRLQWQDIQSYPIQEPPLFQAVLMIPGHP